MGFGCVLGSFGVFMPFMVQQMLYIGNAWKGKTPRTWHFWNIKIPKPPCISSLKIIGLLHFWKILGPSEENYNLQSFWITLYHFQVDPVWVGEPAPMRGGAWGAGERVIMLVFIIIILFICFYENSIGEQNRLTLHNCFWHNWGSLMQQGSDIAPK